MKFSDERNPAIVQRSQLKDGASWLILVVVFATLMWGFLSARANYLDVADVLSFAFETKVVLHEVGVTESEELLVIDFRFRFEGIPPTGEPTFNTLSYSLWADEVYLGRYSSYFGRIALSELPEIEVLTTTAEMRAQYKDRLLENLSIGKNEVRAEGHAEMRVVTTMGDDKVIIPIRWDFEI